MSKVQVIFYYLSLKAFVEEICQNYYGTLNLINPKFQVLTLVEALECRHIIVAYLDTSHHQTW